MTNEGARKPAAAPGTEPTANGSSGRRRVLLVFPPYVASMAGTAYPALLFLRQFLEEAGHEVRFLDLNHEAELLLSEARVLCGLARSRRREIASLERETVLSAAKARRYHQLLEEVGRLRSLEEHVGRISWNDSTKTVSVGGRRVLDSLFSVVDSVLLAGGSADAGEATSCLDLPNLVLSPAVKDFELVFRERLRAEIRELRPHVVGFSVPFLVQLLPTAVLSRLVRRLYPAARVCVGGPVMSLLADGQLLHLLKVGGIDNAVKGEGERALLRLVEAGRRGRGGVPSILHDVGEEVPWPESAPASRAPWQEPGARYLRIPLERYPRHHWSRVPIFQARGCYWGKCSYCDYVNLCGSRKYRRRDAESIVDDMEYHLDRYGDVEFHLLTEALPPKVGGQIADTLLRRNVKARWSSFLRIDPSFDADVVGSLRESGYEPGTLGMESSNDRLLRLIKKGYTSEDILKVFGVFREAPLRFRQINVILDLPTTTYEEALEVVGFCEEWKEMAERFGVFAFEMTSSSEIGADPRSFGLVPLRRGSGAGTRGRFVNAVRFRDPQARLINAARFRDPRGMTEQQKSDIWARYARLNEDLASYMAPVEPSGERILRAKSLDAVEDLALAFPHSFDLGTVSPRFSIRGNRYRRRRETLVFWPKTLRVARERADLLVAWGGRVVGLKSMESELRGSGRIGSVAASAAAAFTLAQQLVEAELVEVYPPFSPTPDARMRRVIAHSLIRRAT